MIEASSHQFRPDSALAFRAIGAAAVSGNFTSTPIALTKLTAYWAKDDWATAKKLHVVVGLEKLPVDGVNALRFSLEVASSAAFASPVEVAALQLTDAHVAAGTKFFDLAFNTDDLAYAAPTATHLRLKMTGAGSDTAYADMTGFLGEAEGYTVTNGVTTTVVAVGTNETGTITISVGPMQAGVKGSGSFAFASVAIANDQVTVNDGVNPARVFTFVASGATGLNVNVGATATDSAANLASVINSAGADPLNVTASSSVGTCTVVNDNYTGGALTEQVDGGAKITTTTFAGGVAPDSLTINDGVNAVQTFSFAVIAPGATAAASATALKTEIQARITANLLDLSVTDNLAGVVTIKNLAAFSGLAASTMVEVADANARMVIADFSGGVSGRKTAAMYQLDSLTYTSQIADIAAFIETNSTNVFDTTVNGNRTVIINTTATAGTSVGTITENADVGGVLAVTAFTVGADAVNFWAFVRND